MGGRLTSRSARACTAGRGTRSFREGVATLGAVAAPACVADVLSFRSRRAPEIHHYLGWCVFGSNQSEAKGTVSTRSKVAVRGEAARRVRFGGRGIGRPRGPRWSGGEG